MKQGHCEMFIDTDSRHSWHIRPSLSFIHEKSRHKTVLILLLLPERCIGQAAHRAEALLLLKVR
jgi:hypothetical protein